MDRLRNIPIELKIVFGIATPFLLVSIYQIISIFIVDPRNMDRFIEFSIVYSLCAFAGFFFILLIETKHRLVVMTLLGVVYIPAIIFSLTIYSFFFGESFFNTSIGGFLLKLANHQ